MTLSCNNIKNIWFQFAMYMSRNAYVTLFFQKIYTKDEVVLALFPFTAQDDDEVSFNAGDWITVLDKTNEDWWKGQVHGSVGIFPRNYVSSPTLNKT